MGILQRSLIASVLILVIIVVRAVFLNRLPKRVFPVLWVVVILRLLLPFSIDSGFSVYNTLFSVTDRRESVPLADVGSKEALENAIGDEGLHVTDNSFEDIPDETSEVIFDAESQQVSHISQKNAGGIYEKVCKGVWIAGIICFAGFFSILYFRGLREFRTALPVENAFIDNWLKDKKLRRTIIARQSDRISAPLTYGLWKPVILFPKNMLKESNQSLEYVLWHEFIHIRRWHTALKIVLMAAVCMHWFNPFIWVMYVLLNKDVELSCDEGVLRCMGETAKKEYASILIGMEENRFRHTPLYNGFSKSDVEKRIRSIMRYKKATVISISAAIVIVLGIVIVFTTSPKEEKQGGSADDEKQIENVEDSGSEEEVSGTESSGDAEQRILAETQILWEVPIEILESEETELNIWESYYTQNQGGIVHFPNYGNWKRPLGLYSFAVTEGMLFVDDSASRRVAILQEGKENQYISIPEDYVCNFMRYDEESGILYLLLENIVAVERWTTIYIAYDVARGKEIEKQELTNAEYKYTLAEKGKLYKYDEEYSDMHVLMEKLGSKGILSCLNKYGDKALYAYLEKDTDNMYLFVAQGTEIVVRSNALEKSVIDWTWQSYGYLYEEKGELKIAYMRLTEDGKLQIVQMK